MAKIAVSAVGRVDSTSYESKRGKTFLRIENLSKDAVVSPRKIVKSTPLYFSKMLKRHIPGMTMAELILVCRWAMN